MWYQTQVQLRARSRGFHLITAEVLAALPEVKKIKIGVLNVFIKHTSASLTINENADSTVRSDFEQVFNRLVPEGESYYLHNDEGPDDLPAHIKSSLLSASLNVPITDGQLNMGVWQGIYLCEHRNYGGSRILVLTVNGQE